MNQLNFNTKKRNFKHLSEYERGEIYAMIKLGCSISSIARHLKRSRTTIYNELKRGRVEQIKNGHKVILYYPDAGQTQYEKNRKNSKKRFKALECIDFIKFVEKSFIERKSRYYKVIKIDSKSSKLVNDALLDYIMESKTKVAEVFKSITSDNGSEFSGLSDLESLVAMYFCHPYSSFERGSNERHNGILRQFIPKGRSINDFSEDEIMYFVDIINAKPRKNLGYRTPEEIFDEEMDKIYSTSGVA